MPDIWLTEEGLAIVAGRRVTEADFPDLAGRIRPDEAAVIVPKEVAEKFFAEIEKKSLTSRGST
jgi:hypothetical protein